MSDLPKPAAPRPAATVVVLRDSPSGPEILMVRRNRAASFMADAWVFPGGRVEETDGDGEPAFAAAAARELAEEAAIQLSPAELVPFARWITPSFEPKRFDARFFVAVAPAGQVARHDAAETVDLRWATAAALLAEQAAGGLKLPPPTLRTLEELAPHGSVEAALAWARRRPIVPILPKLVQEGESIAIVLPWDPEYAALAGEGQPIDPAHPIAARERSRFVLAEGRWWGKPAG